MFPSANISFNMYIVMHVHYMYITCTSHVSICTVQLYDATGGQMKLLAIHPCEKSIRYWQGGDFISIDTIAVWSKVVIEMIY